MVAFTALLRMHSPALRRACLRLARGGHADAEDLFQTVAFNAYRYFDRLEDPDRFLAWCLRIAANAQVDMHRRQLVETTSLDDDVDVEDGGDFAADLVEVAETNQAIRGFLRELSPRARAVFVSRATGVPSLVVAARFQMKRSAVDQMYKRTRDFGRRALSGLAEGGTAVVGAIVPARLRGWCRQRLVRAAELGRRVDGLGATQLAAMIAAVGVGVALMGVPVAARQGGATFGGGSASSAGRQARNAAFARWRADANFASATARRMDRRRGRTEDSFRGGGCGFVLHCSNDRSGGPIPTVEDADPQAGDTVVPVWVPGVGFFWVDATPHPNQVPSSPNDVEQ